MSENQATVVSGHSLRLQLPTKKDIPTVFTGLEVAKILRIGDGSAYLAIARGDVPSVAVGRRILVPRHALEHLLIKPVSRLGHLEPRTKQPKPGKTMNENINVQGRASIIAREMDKTGDVLMPRLVDY